MFAALIPLLAEAAPAAAAAAEAAPAAAAAAEAAPAAAAAAEAAPAAAAAAEVLSSVEDASVMSANAAPIVGDAGAKKADPKSAKVPRQNKRDDSGAVQAPDMSRPTNHIAPDAGALLAQLQRH